MDSLLDDLIAARTGAADQHDLLGIMLNVAHPDTGEKLSALNIRRQILTFLVAGHETTSGALSFALYYLACNPDVLTQAVAETDAILGHHPHAMPAFDRVSKFRYIRRVLDESLRIWPTVPAFARSPRETTTLGGRYRMRPQDHAAILLGRVHRDPSVWDDPEVFDPDRFLAATSRGVRRTATSRSAPVPGPVSVASSQSTSPCSSWPPCCTPTNCVPTPTTRSRSMSG